MEGITDPQGNPVKVDPAEETERQFARAMSEPVGDDKQPPKRAERKPEAPREPPRVRRTPKPSKPAVDAPKPLTREARTEGVKGLAQVGAGTLMLVSTAVSNPTPWQADAVVIVSNADQLAQAVADTAEADERFARIVDKVCAAGPYGALIAVGVSVGTQLARNHGLPIPGTHAPEEILEMAAAA